MKKESHRIDFPESKAFWTHSRIRKLWLTKFRKYRVVIVRHVPKNGLLGSIYYVSKWLVKPGRRDERRNP